MLIPFAPPPGLNSDDTTFSAEGRWADGNNVRFWNGKPQPVGGLVEQFQIANVTNCKSIMALDRSGAVTVAYAFAANGNAPKLFVGSNLSAPTERTPAALPTSTTNWSLASYGTTILACPKDGTLYEQIGTSAAAEVTQAPNAITQILVTAERQVLALGCNEEVSGTFNGRCVRGSDIEDYTDWTTTSTNNAFEHILESSGKIVGGRVIGSYVAVWTETSLFLGQFFGDPGQTYRFDKVDDNCGLVGLNAVTILGQRAYWIGTDLVPRTWAVGELPQMIPFPISKDFISNCSLTERAFIVAATNAKYGEVWFCYCDNRDGSSNTRYLGFSTLNGTWFKGDFDIDFLYENSILLGVPSSLGTSLVSVTRSGRVTLHETGITGTGQAPYSWYMQSADQYLDNSQRRMMIRSFVPDFEDQSASVDLTIFVRDRPNSAAVTKGPYAITTGTTKKDLRASGKIVDVKISGESAYLRLGKPLFDVVPMGER